MLEEKHHLLKKRLNENLEKKHLVEIRINKQFKKLKRLEISLEKIQAAERSVQPRFAIGTCLNREAE
jgi:hypothetical protein